MLSCRTANNCATNFRRFISISLKNKKVMTEHTFKTVPVQISFPSKEEEILKYWKEIDAFQTQLKRTKDLPKYTFYDGPPFATGLPHYGHILAGTIKDVVTRFAVQTGHSVDRRAGWDCHGLPVEHLIDKKLGIKSRQDVLDLGIDKYNDECRKIVMRYSSEWEQTITRCGRWIDFENDYKTLNTSYMESVWWVFKTIFDKGLVYQGYKVMPYSTFLNTPISNFEANLNYHDVSDPSVVVSFPLLNDRETKILAWTTTPWTLPSNLALCVKSTMDYIKIKDVKTGDHYILAASRLAQLYSKPKKGKHYEILEKMKGSALEGLEYVPLFEYFAKFRAQGAFRVLSDDYVTDDSGTGIVHQAPGFGEDDFRVCLKNGIIQKGEGVVCPVDPNGRFDESVSDYTGQNVKEADKAIIADLKSSGRLVRQQQIVHSYPFCWRSDTPLIYKAVPSWFVNVTKIKERLLANTDQTEWVPAFVKEKRFRNWLLDARDWAVSRNRYWGTPLPVWVSEDGQEVRAIGSVAELEEASGVTGITDLHRDKIDHITIPSQQGKGVLRRIDEVFDCWFESGSMPYAQDHYPFENKEEFEKGFPADFVAEGLDQTRGWFYTLMVLSTALFDKPAFKNLICNGLILASDGKKMSKKLKNYPDPTQVVNSYGADALRVYLINSPVVRAEPLRFLESGVFDVVKVVFVPWYHSYRFFVENAERFAKNTGEKFVHNPDVYKESTNVMDKWIIASLQTLVERVRKEMEAYKLYEVTPHLINFLGALSQWYVRFNRERMKGASGVDEARWSLQTLHHVLLWLTRLMAPVTPFLAESMYQNLRRCLPTGSPLFEDSVHYLQVPTVDEGARDPRIETKISRLRSVIELARKARDAKNIRTKQPLSDLTIVNPDADYLQDIVDLQEFVKLDLNVHDVNVSSELEDFVKLTCEPDRQRLGKRLRRQSPAVCNALRELSHDQVMTLQNAGKISVKDCEVFLEDVSINMDFSGDSSKFSSFSGDGGLVALNCELTPALEREGLAREVISKIQKLRKKADLNPSMPVFVFCECPGDSELSRAVVDHRGYIRAQTRLPLFDMTRLPEHAVQIAADESKIFDSDCKVVIVPPCVLFDEKALAPLGEAGFVSELRSFVATKNFAHLQREMKDSKGKLTVSISEKKVMLTEGVEIFTSW
eukprot:85190_1